MENISRIIAPIGISLLVFFFLIGCRVEDKSAVLEFEQQLDSLSVEVATDVNIIYSDSGKIRAEIKAPELKRFTSAEEPYSEMNQGIDAQFYDNYGKKNSRIISDYAIHYELKKLIKLENNVHVLNNKNQELRSEELYWDQIKKTLYTNKYVSIKDGADVWQGEGFTSNETFTKWRILKPTGQKKLNDLNLNESQ